MLEYLISILSVIYLDVELLGHAIIPSLTFDENSKLFSTVIKFFYIPASTQHGIQILVLHIPTNACRFLSRVFGVLSEDNLVPEKRFPL